MNRNRLGKSDLLVSELGLGCQSLGGGLYYQNKSESLAMVRAAVDAGVNFFDTADHYSQGLSEQWLGEALKGRRHDVILATKAGTHYTNLGTLASRIRPALRPVGRWLRPLKIAFHNMRATQKRQDFSGRYLTGAVEASLRRLKTDYIDLFQLHKPSSGELQAGEWRDALKKLQEQGKIRYFGISCATVDDAVLLLGDQNITSVQIGISLIDMDGVIQFLNKANRQSLGVIARNPRSQGHLTAEWSDIMGETYAKNRGDFEKKMQLARKFEFLVNEHRTLAQAAIQFVLQLPGISTAIPRAVNVAQLENNLGALSAPMLEGDELARIASTQARCAGSCKDDVSRN
jgi:aryl-alcohol dehydrogenase-like predicted oxidoreductase